MKSKIVPVQNIARLTTAAHALTHRAHGVPGMALVEGEPGLGKSTAITWLCLQNHGVHVRAMATWTPAAMLAALLHELSRAPRGGCTQMMMDLIQALGETRRPLFIDEADYIVDSKKMTESLRDLHDMTDSPVVLIGMGGIGKRLAHREQLHSRLMQKVVFQPCDLHDTQLLADELCEIKVLPDLAQHIHQLTGGSARRIVVTLATIEQNAKARGLTQFGLGDLKKGTL